MRWLLKSAALVLVFVVSASAHPMGNFSINQYSRLFLTGNSIQIDYVLDFAEIPAFQMFSSQGNRSFTDLETEVGKLSEVWVSGLNLQIDGNPLPLRLTASRSDKIPTGPGLSTVRVVMRLEALWQNPDGILTFKDSNYSERIGWKEVVVQSDGSIDFPRGNPYAADRTQGLTNYPADPLVSPPSAQYASLRVAPGSDRHTVNRAISSFFADPRKTSGPEADRLGDMLRSPVLPLQVVFIGLAVAFSLGALHALSPGHGKTIVAAYLVGNRGTAKHAMFLGAVVTFTHTIGVFVLGLLTLFASQYVVPEKLYPWMGFASGLMILTIGVGLFRQRLKKIRSNGDVDHEHGHDHSHDGSDGSHTHRHGGTVHTHGIPDTITLRTLLTLGVSGGIVPCPSALVVLLSAVALHRIQLGLLLIVAFSVGLATVLVAIGLLVLRAQKYVAQFRGAGQFARVMPLVSAIVITVIGVGISFQSIAGIAP